MKHLFSLYLCLLMITGCVIRSPEEVERNYRVQRQQAPPENLPIATPTPPLSPPKASATPPPPYERPQAQTEEVQEEDEDGAIIFDYYYLHTPQGMELRRKFERRSQ
jgi:hypothetical protein